MYIFFNLVVYVCQLSSPEKDYILCILILCPLDLFKNFQSLVRRYFLLIYVMFKGALSFWDTSGDRSSETMPIVPTAAITDTSETDPNQ